MYDVRTGREDERSVPKKQVVVMRQIAVHAYRVLFEHIS